MRRPSFCLHVRLGLSKLISQLGKGEIAGVFLPACNFTDALLLSLNSLRFVGKGLTGTGLFLTVPTVMRPCDGTSGLVRGNRQKAVFAFKGCFPAAFAAGIHGSHGLCSHYFSRNGVFDETLLSLAVI